MEELNQLITVHVQELVQVHTPEGELAESPLQNSSNDSTAGPGWLDQLSKGAAHAVTRLEGSYVACVACEAVTWFT